MDINQLILSDAAIDALEGGAWVGELPGAPGVEVKVIGTTSAAYRKAIAAKIEALRKGSKGVPLDQDQVTACVREVFAEFALVDWRGLTKDGEPFLFDREVAKQWLTSVNGERFADLVAGAAQRLDADANSYAETVTKN